MCGTVLPHLSYYELLTCTSLLPHTILQCVLSVAHSNVCTVLAFQVPTCCCECHKRRSQVRSSWLLFTCMTHRHTRSNIQIARTDCGSNVPKTMCLSSTPVVTPMLRALSSVACGLLFSDVRQPPVATTANCQTNKQTAWRVRRAEL